jgi:hypothetical protein
MPFAQIDSRSKFLTAVAATPLYIPGLTAIDSVMTLAGFTGAAPVGATGATGALYRDLGREVVAYTSITPGAGAVKRAVFRQVAIMSGSGSEGITGTTAALAGYTAYPYVQVFASDAAAGSVGVVRTG